MHLSRIIDKFCFTFFSGEKRNSRPRQATVTSISTAAIGPVIAFGMVSEIVGTHLQPTGDGIPALVLERGRRRGIIAPTRVMMRAVAVVW